MVSEVVMKVAKIDARVGTLSAEEKHRPEKAVFFFFILRKGINEKIAPFVMSVMTSG